MLSITRVSIFKRASDITRTSSSLTNHLMGVFCIALSIWPWQRRTVVKENFSISPISIFCGKKKILPNKLHSIFPSIVLFLLVNFKLGHFPAKSCIFLYLSFKLSFVACTLLINSSRALFPISMTWGANESAPLLPDLSIPQFNKVSLFRYSENGDSSLL